MNHSPKDLKTFRFCSRRARKNRIVPGAKISPDSSSLSRPPAKIINSRIDEWRSPRSPTRLSATTEHPARRFLWSTPASARKRQPAGKESNARALVNSRARTNACWLNRDAIKNSWTTILVIQSDIDGTLLAFSRFEESWALS